jgi:hypothetical protein
MRNWTQYASLASTSEMGALILPCGYNLFFVKTIAIMNTTMIPNNTGKNFEHQ